MYNNEREHSETNYVDVSTSQEPSAFSSGYLLGENFRLEKRLGRGGMGEAWKAYDETADRFVVLKFIPKEIQHVQEAIDLVRSSFKKVHALQHQHICPVYGLFTDSQHGLYLAMKYIDGIPLDTYRRKYVKKHGKILFSDIVQILWGIAKGLDYAHEKKVIHRDIKPQNIMIGKSDGVQIIDFGLAEEIRTSMVRFSHEPQMTAAGTRSYMAPEQWRGRLQDARTDQYALAVTAYEMFSGHVPFSGSDIAILRECVLKDDPEPITELPEYVNAALLKALSKKREERYENCKAFIKAMITKPQKSENTETNIEEIALDETNTEQSALLNQPSDYQTNTEQKNAWLPQTIFSLSKPLSTVQKTKNQFKKIKPFWLVLTVITGMILIFGVGAFLLQNIRKPVISPSLSLIKQPIENTTASPEKTDEKQITESVIVEPANVESANVETPNPESLEMESPETEQNTLEPEQLAVDDLPKENVTEENIAEEKIITEQSVENKTVDEKELLKITEFKNGYLPQLAPQKKDFHWVWHGRETQNSEMLSTLSNHMDVFRIEVHKKIRDKFWLPSLSYRHFPLIKGRVYRIECESRATAPTEIVVYVLNQNRTDVKKFHTLVNIPIEKNWKTFRHDFLIQENEQTCSLCLDHFNSGIIYEIRRISLRDISTGSGTSIPETTEPMELTEARRRFEEEIEQIKIPYRDALEKEIDLAKKNKESSRSLKLATELKYHVSEKGLKPTVYEPDRRRLSIEKVHYKNKANAALNSYKNLLTELAKTFVQTNRLEESKIVQEIIEHTVPEIITTKLLKREPIPVLRLILEIGDDKNGRFRIEHGLASDPPDGQIQGDPFNIAAFPHALAFRGDNGLGRIIWDFQDPISTWHNSGWTEIPFGIFNKVLSGIKIDEKKGLLLFYPNSSSHNMEERLPGLFINRFVKFPIRLCCDYIEKQDGTLIMSMDLNEYELLGFSANYTASNGNIQLRSGINWQSEPIIRQTISRSQLPFEHTFQLPEKYHTSVPNYLRMRKSDTNGTVTRFDMIARFSAWVGLTIKQQDKRLIVENVLEKSPAQRAGLLFGDVIVMFNGKIRTEKEVNEILNSSVFGDLIVLTVVRGNERKVIRFHAE